MDWRHRAAIAVSASTVLALVGGAVLTAVEPGPSTLSTLAFSVAAAALFTGLGLVVVRRTTGAVVGLLMTVVGQQIALTCTKQIGWHVLAARPATADRLSWLVAVLQESAWWVLASAMLLILHFPDGRLPGRRWRWVPAALVATVAATQVSGALEQTPFLAPLQSVPRPFGPGPAVLMALLLADFFVMMGLLLACAAAPFVRFRRSTPLQRTQLKWLAIAGLGLPAYPLLCLIEVALVGRPVWFSATVGLVALIGLPLSVTVAMVRHDLYDVDRALAGAVSWAAVSAGLAALYAAVTVALGLVVGRGSAVSAAVGVALCALALAPLRVRVQRVVDRRLYPRRRAAFEAVDALLAEVSAGRAEPETLEDQLRVALRDPGLRVGFTLPGEARTVGADGQDLAAPAAAEPTGVPVVLGQTTIGVLVPGPDGTNSADLLRQVAGRCAPLAELVRLRLELAAALRDVEQSRARLVQAGFEERRRLERDLHDGAQQRLVSLGMALRLAQRHLGDGSVDVDGLLDRSVAELGTAVAELRQIAHGLRPASLDDGLAVAVATMLRSLPISVDLDICADPLPDDVSTTAYYVVSEAVTNAVKHAQATRISLRIRREGEHLELRVSDDGNGGATLPATSSIPDRVAALRGTWRVDSPRGRGTIVEAALPCAS